MSARPIIDAGPCLNFLSINKERLLIAVLGPLSAPETVQDEVLTKSQQDDRFRAAATVWKKLTTRWIQILPDDATPELVTVIQRVSGLPMSERRRQPKDLGETMVIAHAVVAAESGQSVTILMDDGPGAMIATSEINRLQRLASSGHTVGSIRLANTPRPFQDRLLLPGGGYCHAQPSQSGATVRRAGSDFEKNSSVPR